MTYKVICHNNVTLLIHNDEIKNGIDIFEKVKQALCVCGFPVWEKIAVQIFAGQRETLVIAFPSKKEE